MNTFKLKYLGTAAAEGYPAVFCMCPSCQNAQKAGGKNIRLRSSAIINDEILVDISPDFVCFKSKFNIDIKKIKTILLTHTHQDHFYPQILSYNHTSFSNKPLKLNIYLSEYAKDLFEKIEIEKSDAKNNLNLIAVKPFESYKENDYIITPLEAAHNTPQSLIYIISYNGVNMLYGNDTAMLTKNTFDYLHSVKLDIVSLDSTRGKEEGQYFRHMGFNDIIYLKKYFIKNGICDENSIFTVTHFSHWINMLHDEMVEYLKPYNILPAYDGMIIEK